MNVRLVAAVAGVAVLMSGAAGSAQIPTPAAYTTMPPVVPAPAGPLARDARHLHGTSMPAGYRLAGQALVKDACTAAGFRQSINESYPPQFDVVQYRRPGTRGLLCAPHLTWVTIAPLNVANAAPRYVNVRTQKGVTRVPVLPIPVPAH